VLEERKMLNHAITTAIFLIALTLYGLGFSGLGTVGFIAGGICELWFWLRFFSRRT